MISSQVVYIDSSKRVSGTNSDFVYELKIDQSKKYNRICVLAANIPLSYYIVQDGQNTFTLTEDSQSVVITVPAGNYNANSFKNVVEPLLNSNSPNHWTYKLTLPNGNTQAQTGKYTFEVSNNTSQPILKFDTDVYEQFGFSKNSVNQFVDNKLTSQNVIKFIPEDSLFLRSDVCDTDNDVLQEIYHSNNTPFSNITYQCYDPLYYSKPFRANAKNSVYHFRLTNEAGHLMKLNGLNIVISLLIYKKDNSLDVLKAYAQYRFKDKYIE